MTTKTTPNGTLAPESYDEKFDRMKKHKAQATDTDQEMIGIARTAIVLLIIIVAVVFFLIGRFV